jgi:hypothetical protein
MTMTGRRLLLTSCLIASALGLAPLLLRAQSFPLNLEGYAVADQILASPARSTAALVAPYRAIGMGTNLMIVDETLPAHPVVVSQMSLASPALGMLYHSGKLYLAAGPNGLYVIDVSNPLVPKYSSYLGTVNAQALAMNEGGKILYVADAGEAIQVVNIEKSTVPKKVYAVSYGYARITDLAVVGKYLVAAAGPKGLLIYTLQYPGRPIRVKHFKDLEGATRLSSCPNQDRLFAVADAYKGLVFVNFPTWTTPAIKGTLTLTSTPTWARYLPGSNRVLVGLGTAGYAIADSTDPAAPTLLSQPTTPSPVMSVTTDGSRPYLLCSGSGAYTVNVSNPASPVATLAFAGSDSFGALAQVGNIVYISRGSAIEVWNCSDPYNLTVVGSVSAPGFATDLLISGSLLFAGCQQSGVAIFSLSNPLAPALLSVLPVVGTVGQLTLDGSAGQMALSGNLLAVAAGSDGVLLVDVSVPTAPVAIATWLSKHDSFVTGVAFSSANTLWARGDRTGITSLNVTNPSAPTELGSLGLDSLAGRSYLYSNYIISPSGTVCEITTAADPTKPTSYSRITTTGASFAAFQGTTMFLSDGVTGFSEIDLTTPDLAVTESLFGSPTFTYQAVPLSNGARLVSAREGGLWSLVPTSCDGPLLRLPCEGATLSPITRPIFTWKPVTDATYTVQVSETAEFKSGKTFTSSTTGDTKKIPSFQPGDGEWMGIVRGAQKSGGTLYWRVVYDLGKTNTRSEVRTFRIP